jgi:hypothetical protein
MLDISRDLELSWGSGCPDSFDEVFDRGDSESAALNI